MPKGKIFYLLFFSLFWVFGTKAQLKVDAQISIEAAINRLVGQGVKVSNVRVNCPSEGGRPYGYFTDNTGTLGIDDGLIITTGSATNAIGPNNSGAISQSNKNEVQDSDLQNIITSGEKQFDACVIEFDVEVFADTLTFDYVFGSDEYLEFIKDYHDVFGFFISGPGISGKLNLATVPGTFDPVSVKNINNAKNSNLYIDNGTGTTAFDNLFVQYDGFTRRLESKVAVQPCQIYSLKLAICDIKDDIYDAGIFIAGKSLRTKAPSLSLRYEFPKFPTAIEGCNGVFVKIKRQSQINKPITFYLAYSGTATNGSDYGNGPDSVRLDSGQAEYEFFIPIGLDKEADDNETILIDLLNPCPGLPQVDQLSITIRETFDYQQKDGKICLGDTIQLNKTPKSGFQYEWFPKIGLSCFDCPSPITSPDSSKKYLSKVKDLESGCAAQDSMEIQVKPVPTANFSFESNENYTSLDVFFKNKSENANAFSWSFGDGTESKEKDPLKAYAIGFDRDTLVYSINMKASNSELGCSDSSSAFVKIGKPFFIPSLITTNNDGLNDAFFIQGITAGKWKCEIYNRWGHLVYENKTYNMDWNAEENTEGVYFYKIQNQPGDRIFTGWLKVLK
jgi:gliding motility-associated-like protein